MMNESLRQVREKNAELVKEASPVGDGGEQPAEVSLINALWNECDDFEKCSGVGTKLLRHWGSQGEFDRGGEALVVHRLQHARPLPLPLSCQPVCTPLVLMCDSCE